MPKVEENLQNWCCQCSHQCAARCITSPDSRKPYSQYKPLESPECLWVCLFILLLKSQNSLTNWHHKQDLNRTTTSVNANFNKFWKLPCLTLTRFCTWKILNDCPCSIKSANFGIKCESAASKGEYKASCICGFQFVMLVGCQKRCRSDRVFNLDHPLNKGSSLTLGDSRWAFPSLNLKVFVCGRWDQYLPLVCWGVRLGWFFPDKGLCTNQY